MNLDKSHIRKTALELLKLRKYRVWRNNNIAVPGRKFIGQLGVPDIIGWELTTSRAVFCDVKTLDDHLSKDQIELMSALHQSGGICLIATQLGSQVVIIEFVEYLAKSRSKTSSP